MAPIGGPIEMRKKLWLNNACVPLGFHISTKGNDSKVLKCPKTIWLFSGNSCYFPLLWLNLKSLWSSLQSLLLTRRSKILFLTHISTVCMFVLQLRHFNNAVFIFLSTCPKSRCPDTRLTSFFSVKIFYDLIVIASDVFVMRPLDGAKTRCLPTKDVTFSQCMSWKYFLMRKLLFVTICHMSQLCDGMKTVSLTVKYVHEETRVSLDGLCVDLTSFPFWCLFLLHCNKITVIVIWNDTIEMHSEMSPFDQKLQRLIHKLL